MPRLFTACIAIATAAAMAAMTLVAPAPAAAQQARLSLVRDAEIEAILRAYAQPIFAMAGYGGGFINVHIVNDERLNAFVAGGRHMFINTGLLKRATDAGQIIGVIAHETGHIAGAHLVSLRQAVREAQIRQIISFLLSAAAAAAARDGRIAAAGSTLGARITEGTFFQYTRTMERAADQFAVEVLDRLQISSKGMLEMFRMLAGQEVLQTTNQDPYLRTHPLTQERIAFVEQHMKRSPYTNRPLPARYQAMQTRLRAKLIGFLDPPSHVYAKYEGNDKSLEARYALAVAYHRDARVDKALGYIDSLIKEYPKDPYFHELRGQILLESSRVPEAVQSYKLAARYAPNEPLILSGLAHAQIESNDKRELPSAIRNLRRSLRRDKTNALAWRLLGVAYGRVGNFGASSLALAEYYVLTGNRADLQLAIARGERYLKRGSPGWQRLQDIKSLLGQAPRRR